MRCSRTPCGALLAAAAAAAACSSSSTERAVLTGGALVAIKEGETLTRTLSHPAGPRGARPADWATVVGLTLTLTPPCSLIPGTDGPPHLFTLDLDNGDDPVLVQVTPTLDGRCLPRVLACLTDPGAGPAGDCSGPLDPASFAPYQDQSTGARNDRFIAIAFCSDRPDCPRADRALHFKLYDPEDPTGTGTSMLYARLTTDAPLVFPRDDATQSFDDKTDPIGAVYNAHIVGEFRVSYEIATARSATARIATGAYSLVWSDARPKENPRLGIQAAWCASASPMGCAVASAPSAPACIAPRARPVTIGLRLWIATQAFQNDANAMHVTARIGDGSLPLAVVFTSTSEVRPQQIDLRFDAAGMLPVTAELDVGSDADQIVTFSGWACALNRGGPTTAPRCATVGGPPDATLALLIKAPGAGQCP